MISVGSEVIKNFQAITLRSYGGEEGKLISGRFFPGDGLAEALTLSVALSEVSYGDHYTNSLRVQVRLMPQPTYSWVMVSRENTDVQVLGVLIPKMLLSRTNYRT